jgi:hypothetical protein
MAATRGQVAPNLGPRNRGESRHSLDEMSEQQQAADSSSVLAGTFAAQAAAFWLAILGSLGMIVGGIAPWATAFTFQSFSGTRMHGWREVAAGALAVIMLGLYHMRPARPPLIAAAVIGALGAIGAVVTWSKIQSGGVSTIFGMQYRYLDPAWGLYLVLGGALTLLFAASALAWRARRY